MFRARPKPSSALPALPQPRLPDIARIHATPLPRNIQQIHTDAPSDLQNPYGIMFKTNIKTLFRDVASIPLETAGPDLLAHISFGCRNLLILAYTMPWITKTLGDQAAPHALTTKIFQVSDRLAGELEKDMTVEDRARYIVYLLHTLNFHYDPDHMQIAQNAATEIIDSMEPALKEPAQIEPNLCKILSYDYYFRAEKDSRKKAENLLTQWKEQLQQEGSWKDLTADTALQRLEAYALYSDVADQHKFENTLRKALQYYIELPEIINEVRLLFLLAQMGQFGNYTQQVEQIMDNVLNGKLTATATGSIAATATGSISDINIKEDPQMLTALQFHILALYLLNTEQE